MLLIDALGLFLYKCGDNTLSDLHLIVNVKVVPGPFCSSKYIVPPNSSTIVLQMQRPSPIPDVFIAAVYSNLPNKWNSFILSSSEIPIPVSATLILIKEVSKL